MTKSLPTISQMGYKAEADNNNGQIEVVFRQFFPSFPQFSIPFEDVINILSYLEETGVNPQILPRVIRGIKNITLGSGEGEVIVHVKRDIVSVEARERDPQMNTKALDTR